MYFPLCGLHMPDVSFLHMCFSVLVIRLALSFLSCSLESVSGNIAAVRCHVDLPVPVLTHKRMGFYCSEILIIDDLGALLTLFLCVSVAETDGLCRQYMFVWLLDSCHCSK